jgi:hypothetical protein
MLSDPNLPGISRALAGAFVFLILVILMVFSSTIYYFRKHQVSSSPCPSLSESDISSHSLQESNSALQRLICFFLEIPRPLITRQPLCKSR